MPRLSPAFLLLLVALGFVSCSHAPQTAWPASAARWPHELSDLKPDPAVRWGRLDNGLRYAILPHGTPRQRASVFLHVDVGSYHERSRELGYAHFVEHLAFRELRGFPDGIFAMLEKLGAGHSPHSNGSTSPFETQYRFDHLPVDDPTALATGLTLLRAIADSIVFTPAGVDRERGVIFDEQRSLDSLTANARPDELEFLPPRGDQPEGTEIQALFRRTRLLERPAIGIEKTLRAATADRLRAFYDRWYRPERMIVTVAGDIAPDEAERLVRETFGSLAARTRAPAEPARELPKPTPTLRIHVSDWDTEPVTRLTLASLQPHTAADTIARRRQSLARRLALAMLDRRLERAMQTPDAPFLSAEPVLSHRVPGAAMLLLRANVAPPQWPRALAALDFEGRRISEQGFSPPELQRAIKAETLATASAARQADTRSSADLAQALAFSIARGVVYTAADDDRDLSAAQLATLTEADCQAAFIELVGRQEFALSIAGPFREGTPKPDLAPKALTDSRAAPLTPYAAPPPLQPFPFTDFGPAGQVVKTERDPLLDTELIRFANGVRLNLKQTSFEPGRVSVLVRLDGGRLACPTDQPGLDLKLLDWLFGGIDGLSLEQLGASISDLSAGFGFNIATGDVRLTAREDASNLPLLLQLGAAHFVRPGFHAHPRARDLARRKTAHLFVTASGVAELALRDRMSGSHPAVGRHSIDDPDRITLDQLKAWLIPHLAQTPLEISIIGDFDSTAATDAVARTFGALPPRSTADPYAEQRKLSFPPAPFAEAITFEGNRGVAHAVLAWPLPPPGPMLAYPARFRAQIIAKILEQRLWQAFRVEGGETYRLGASFETNHELFHLAADYLQCHLEASPDRVDALAVRLGEITRALATGGATADELERARQPFVRDTESGLRDNSWLLDMISVAQSNPAYAHGWAGALHEYRSVTLAEINDALRAWLAPDRACQIVAKPKEP